MRNVIAGLILFLGLASPALAQRVVPPAVTANCAFNTSPPTVTSGQMVMIQCDSSGRLILSPSGSGGGAVFGPTAAGSPAANPPVQIGGTATGTSTSNVVNATVKTASTQAASTDTSVVAQLNPLSPGIITYVDPCQNPGVLKSSVPINITSGATTQLVPISGSTSIYVCGGSISIAPSATAADTAQFEYGTSTNCTGASKLTGLFGAGDLTSATSPIVVPLGTGAGTSMTAPSANGLCILSAGTAVSIQGFLTYVQQ